MVAVGLASLVPLSPAAAADLSGEGRDGVTRAADVLEKYLGEIERRDDDVHAFNRVLTDESRARAAEIDDAVAMGRNLGTLAGVPVALKDNMCTRGIPTTCSSKILDG